MLFITLVSVGWLPDSVSFVLLVPNRTLYFSNRDEECNLGKRFIEMVCLCVQHVLSS